MRSLLLCKVPARIMRIRPGTAVERVILPVGPALILTAVVLACGVAGIRRLRSPRLFGWVSAFATSDDPLDA